MSTISLSGEAVCRFCAKAKASSDIFSFSKNLNVLNNCLEILNFFKIESINLTQDGNLPRNICTTCYKLLQESHSFFEMIIQSQSILYSKYSAEIKIEYPDDISAANSSHVKEESNVTLSSLPAGDLKTKVNENCVVLQSHLKAPFKSDKLDNKQDNELKIEKVDLPEFNNRSTSGYTYAGLNIFREEPKSWNFYSWKCKCSSRFPTLSQVRTHSTNNHRTCFSLTCDDCSNTFLTFDEFSEHIRNHRENLRYFCKYCDCAHNTIKECTDHEQTHTLICDVCGQMFTNEKLLTKHKKKVFKSLKQDSDDSLTSIEFDDGILPIPPSSYVIETWRDYPWICRLCNIAFKTINQWRCHIKEEHQKCAVYKCFDCNSYRPKKLRHLIAHIKQHRPQLRLQCHICNEVKENAESLSEHIKLHQQNNLFCDYCGETFTNSNALNKHIQTYNKKQLRRLHPLTIEELTCKVCNIVLQSRKHLWSHKSKHEKQIYTCDKCGKLFKNKNTLDNHMSRYDKKYECDICGRCFAQKIHVTKHLATHTDEKPFCCDKCGFKCRDVFKLRQHQIRHTNNAPFVCLICNKAFKAALYLKRHQVQHTGEKPYSCKFCERAFTNVPNRHKHMKRIHGALMMKDNSKP